MSLLQCRGLTRAWGAFRAVDGVDLDLAEREVCAVIGPNGAGKSTLFAMIAANLRKTAGAVILGGEDVSALPAHALANRPRLLILDEPTQGMSLTDTRRTVELLRRVLAEAQTAILLVEHDLDVVFELAPRIAVLHRGRKIADGPTAEVRADPGVQAAYLGGLD